MPDEDYIFYPIFVENNLHMKPEFSIFSVLISLILICPSQGYSQIKENAEFTFVFITDIHVQPERHAVEGYRQAVDTINSINPDFVITGGDLIMDALGQTYGRADSLYNIYQEETERFNVPVYNTLGNHEIFGIYDTTFANAYHPEYGEAIFEKRLGNSYYSFMKDGWKFIIINSVEDTRENRYIGEVDSVQMDWIASELNNTDPETPIVISTHIPFITSFKQVYYGSTIANDSGLVVINSKEVLELFNGHNLKLVLQGHLHIVEDIYVNGVHFITGGAISAHWWKGPNRGFQEGFVLIKVFGGNFEWEYVDYGWEVDPAWLEEE